MTARPKMPPPLPIALEAFTAVREWLVRFAAWGWLAAGGCLLLTVTGVASALAWHLARWAWTERAQLMVMVAVILFGLVLWRIDRHAQDEREGDR